MQKLERHPQLQNACRDSHDLSPEPEDRTTSGPWPEGLPRLSDQCAGGVGPTPTTAVATAQWVWGEGTKFAVQHVPEASGGLWK